MEKTPQNFVISVLCISGILLAIYLKAEMPELAKDFAVLASIYVFVAFLYYTPKIGSAVCEAIRNIRKAGIPQATRVAGKVGKDHFESYVEPCINIDYENYYIPTFLRQEGGRK